MIDDLDSCFLECSTFSMKSLISPLQLNSTIKLIVASFSRPVSLELMQAFQTYFAFHIFISALLFYLIKPGKTYTALGLIILLAASIASASKRYCQFGLLVLLAYHFFWLIVGNFPWTANHYFLEGYILLFLVLFPIRIVDKAKNLVDGTSCHLIQFTILYAYFFSAFHKIFQGFWLNGEFLGWSLFQDASLALFYSSQWIIKALISLLGLSADGIPFEFSPGMARTAIAIPTWLTFTLIAVHCAIILVELSVPVLVVIYRNQKLGRYLLLAMTIGIGLPSLEFIFMFVALGCDFLFFPQRPQRNYTALLLLHSLLPIALIGLHLLKVFPY